MKIRKIIGGLGVGAAAGLSYLGRRAINKIDDMTPTTDNGSAGFIADDVARAFREVLGTDLNGRSLVRTNGPGCCYDHDDQAWRMAISSFQEINDAHLREVERLIGVPHESMSIRDITATVKMLTIA